MNRQELITLMTAAARREATANFTAANIQEAAKNALVSYLGLENEVISARSLREHRDAYFSIIEEVVDKVVPVNVTNILGDVAEVKTFSRDSEVKFKIEKVGANRIKAAIVPGARGGVYRARRLDTGSMYLDTEVITIGYNVTLEEILSGERTVADIIAVITEGFTQKVWIEVVKALRAAYSSVPAKNKAEHTGDEIDLAGVDKVVRTVSAYGIPYIMGFASLINQLTNKVGFTGASPNIPSQDLMDVREQGYVGRYKGTAVIKLPNYFVDETNETWMFKETDMFILPSGARPIKVAFKGDAYTAEVPQPHGGVEWHMHKLMGVGILFYNNIGLYRQTSVSALDADGLY